MAGHLASQNQRKYVFIFFLHTCKKCENGWVVQNLATPKARMIQGVDLKANTKGIRLSFELAQFVQCFFPCGHTGIMTLSADPEQRFLG